MMATKNISADYLVQAWQERYVPDFLTICSKENYLDFYDLVKLTSHQEKAKTVEKARCLLKIHCECSSTKDNIVFSYIPHIIKLSDFEKIALYIQLTYKKLLSVYQQQSPLNVSGEILSQARPILRKIDISSEFFENWLMPTLRLSMVEQLYKEIQPTLLELREKHLLTNDLRLIGFISTQFNFSTAFIFNKLNLAEQLLLSPYFKFVEEQVCIPWQRVCNAAAAHSPNSKSLAIVRRMLPASREIAYAVHQRASEIYPNHSSRRGKLNEPGVKASSIRDIEMFQAYLWLCLLEESMEAVERELLPLCVLVFPSIEVEWELVEQTVPLLTAEFGHRLEAEQMHLLRPYTQAMQQILSKPRMKIV